MASGVYARFKELVGSGLDLSDSGVRASFVAVPLKVAGSTTCDTELALNADEDPLNIVGATDGAANGFTTRGFNESTGFTGTGTSHGAAHFPLSGVTWTRDNVNNRMVFDASDLSLGSPSGDDCKAILVYYDPDDNLATAVPAFYSEFATDREFDGSAFTVVWPSTGIGYF